MFYVLLQNAFDFEGRLFEKKNLPSTAAQGVVVLYRLYTTLCERAELTTQQTKNT